MSRLISFFIVGYAVERVLETFWNRDKINGEITAPCTLYLLVGAYALMYLFVLWEWFSWEASELSIWISFMGIGLVMLSLIGRNWAIRSLGPYHSIHIEIRPNHELIQRGPYKIVRNPYYLSNIVEAVGLPLVVNATVASLISFFVYMPLLIIRLILEEKALERKFADSFVIYKNHVPRMLPKLFRR